MLEKKLFNTFAFAWSVLIISTPSTSVIFSLETHLLETNGFTDLQNFAIITYVFLI